LSHLKERAEKNCLNCNAQVYGRYCHICGQENVEPKETALHLVSHFFQDITHFDGKFFSSIKWLITRPGFLSHEYMIGRRASNLNPIRMYVFASALFFLIFFSFYHFDAKKSIKTTVNNVPVSEMIKMDSVKYRQFVDELVKNDSAMKFAYDKVRYLQYLDSLTIGKGGFHFTPSKYTTREAYDSALKKGKGDGWLARALVYKQIEINEKYKNDGKAALEALGNIFIHSIPQILFVSLPLFALLLNILYYRKKEFYYVNHAIFTIHLFVFVFIALLIVFGINKIETATHWDWLGYLSGFMTLFIFIYNYKAMRIFYQQGRWKTVLKFILLHFTNLFIVMILFVIFIFLSLFKI
jgi:hypothetical protein